MSDDQSKRETVNLKDYNVTFVKMVAVCTCGRVFGSGKKAEAHIQHRPEEEVHLWRKVELE